MKNKTQAVLGLLFIISFIKSFKYSMTAYDTVFIILITVTYLSKYYITEQSTKQELKKLTEDIDLKLKLQDEEIERAKNISSKAALAFGVKR
jgi:hypothetical protein